MEIRSDRVYKFPLARPELWDALCDLDRYQTWWPWLSRFEALALEEGELWRCTVRPPMPYALHADIHITAVKAPELIEADLHGDLSGWARVELHESAEAVTEVQLTTSLVAASAPIRLGSRAFPRLARWGHDWVLNTAARQFRAAMTSDRA